MQTMKTSVKKYNKRYEDGSIYVDGYSNPEIVKTCNDYERCQDCPSHVYAKLHSIHSIQEGWLDIYQCPIGGKYYAVLYR